ncbi:unnamed protein product [Cladocopium goreaui]|uniref:Ribosomal protein L15 n=1 Tax=Cladocopium goreaui TaxID=2562237 RepID=A0A9P1CYE8_9DINO|nr:unnamed protein product [Cladocopium goreaui]
MPRWKWQHRNSWGIYCSSAEWTESASARRVSAIGQPSVEEIGAFWISSVDLNSMVIVLSLEPTSYRLKPSSRELRGARSLGSRHRPGHNGIPQGLTYAIRAHQDSSGGTREVMGAYKYLEEMWRKKQSEAWSDFSWGNAMSNKGDVMRFLARLRNWEFRQLPAVHRCSRPTRPDKARKVGYKAKQGYCIYRVRVKRGDRKKRVAKGIVYGKPTNQGINKWKSVRNLRSIAEERVGRKCGSLRVLNSYWVAQDAVHKWYEVVMVDPFHSVIRNDPRINWICKPVMKHRELRGLTAAGRKARGLLKKGKRATKLRPSARAVYRGGLSLWGRSGTNLGLSWLLHLSGIYMDKTFCKLYIQLMIYGDLT